MINIKKKTIFLYINQGFALRYFLRTDILKTIAKSSTQVVIVSHNGDERSFRKTFESENVKVEKCNHEAYAQYRRKFRLHRILEGMRAFVLNGKYDTRTVDDFRAIHKAQMGWTIEGGLKGWIIGLLWESVVKLLKMSKTLRRLLIAFESHMYCPKVHKHLFEKYSPDLVVVNSLCGFQYNEYFAREAHYYGRVPVCSVILSWDNTSGNGMPGYDVDYVVAWTENMRRELVELNDIDNEKIFIGGVAHYDSYYNDNIVLDRNLYCKRLGLDPGKKTIFYATKSPKRFPWGPELVAELAEAIQKGIINDSSQILVRIHPLHYRTAGGRLIFEDILNEFEKVAGKYSCVVLNVPETVSKEMDFVLSDSESTLVASILKHSDIMLNMFSTMVIEASIFKLPSINVCIREKCKSDFGKTRQDIMVDYVQSHNNRVVQTGGVKTVFTEAELYEAINLYLDNPETDAGGREMIKENEAGPFCGNAGEMIGKHILSLVGC